MASRARKVRKSVNKKGDLKAGGAKGLENVIEPQAEQKPEQHGQDGPVGDKADGHRVEDNSRPLDGTNSCTSSRGRASPEPDNLKFVVVGEEAAVGSIHHILKTAFKELYTGADDGHRDLEQKAATANKHMFSATETLQPCLAPTGAVSLRENGEISLDFSAVRREGRTHIDFFITSSRRGFYVPMP